MREINDDDDDDVIGPASANGADELAAERRRVAMLAAKAAEDKKVKREEWMLQLPKKLNNYGLGARTFSKSAGVSSSEQADWMQARGTDPADQPGTSRDDMERLIRDDDDDDVIGPMPASANGAEELAAERRRVAMLAANAAEDKKVKRKEWMLQLPKKLNNYGLGARTFSKSAGVSSSEQADLMRAPGTDPVDQPGTSRDDMERLANAERDAQQARIASALTASRNESLLDAHASRKRKAEADAPAAFGASMSGGAPERRPLDREKDMQIRGFKSASTAEIKEKCGHLSSRFGNSNSQKFL